jgi:menaquinone-9 beta-reductase
MQSVTHTDVCVIGGGPAGLAAALAARQQGFRVSVFDCAVPPIDKACGEGLMPDSLQVLQGLGVSVAALDGSPFRGLRFLDGFTVASADFSQGRGYAVRRTALHRALAEQAYRAGVQLHWNCKGAKATESGVLVNGTVIKSEFVIGADGQNSHVRRNSGLDVSWYRSRRYGFRQHFRLPPWSEYVEVHWQKNFQVYVTPVHEREVGVAVVSHNPKLRITEALAAFPDLQLRLRNAAPASPEAGALTVSRRLRNVWKNNVALIGDASGSVDSITGEGLCLAFQQAHALGEALKQGDLHRYQNAHNRINRRARFMSRLLLLLSSHDLLRQRVLQALERQPDIFARFLDFHTGQGSLLAIKAQEWYQLSAQILGG